MEYMTIDGIPVPIEGEKNILEVIRKAGVKLPTFCYHSELSIYGACRMCMIEDEKGRLDAACSAQPWPGMVIRTNSAKLRKHRKMILELILANHCRDCTLCPSNKNCKLQDLASRFHIEDVRFPNGSEKQSKDESSPAIVKDNGKCILCGDCVRMCNEVQNVGAIDFAHRGSKMVISTAFDVPLCDSGCVACGQCAAVCPTGAIVVRDDSAKLWKDLSNPDVKVTAQIAPAVRVAIGRELGLGESNAFGYIVAALHRIGFDEVFDTSTGADLTVLEESNELLGRLESGAHEVPLFSSCCPAWVNYCERYHPELLPHLSTCRSPMQMLAAIVKEHNAIASSRKTVHVAVMPCTAKKLEAEREEFKKDGVPYVDYVITTQELVKIIRESGIVFSELEAESVDTPFAAMTGAGVIFGSTGGVTEAVLRRISTDKSSAGLRMLAMQGVRGMDGVKQTKVALGDKELNIAVVSGLKNAEALIRRIKDGERFDFVEVMACPGGCVSGAGQPYAPEAEKSERSERLYASDKLMSVKRSEENPLMTSLYSGILKNRVHELLHVHYGKRKG